MIGLAVLLFSLFSASLSISTPKSSGDFVDTVTCNAHGMDIRLKERLPLPRSGMWTLEVEGHPKCPGGSKTDVGGGYMFVILYADKQWCGVEPASWFTPSWVSYAEITLLLRDSNGTKIADSVSCVYNTRFDTSLLTFKGEITNENLRYGGSLEEEGTDVESMVNSGNSVRMDFYDGEGKTMEQRTVKLGDPLVFRIDVSESNAVSKILPETCYFSSSSIAEENPTFGQTLTFVRKNCFNEKNGMVKAFLQKMERNSNGTLYELSFPAFHFKEFGRNLFVHCTILACIGDQPLCDPKSNCFGTSRRKRATVDSADERYNGRLRENSEETKEFIMTKYIIVEDKRQERTFVEPARLDTVFAKSTICLQTSHFAVMAAIVASSMLILLVLVSCMGGALARKRSSTAQADKVCRYYLNGPPAYSNSVRDLPTITSF